VNRLLTPQEVAEKRFGKSFMGGYDMAAVDDFLEALTDDYTSLYKENALLKNKIRVLVDKLEEYRSVDESMRKTWREAQRNAEEMMSQARAEADTLIADAVRHADSRSGELHRQLEAEEFRLSTAQQQTITFVNSLREIYQRQIEQLSVIPTIEPPPQTASQAIQAATSQVAFEIEQSVMTQIESDYEDHASDTRTYDRIPDSESESAPPPGPDKSDPSADVSVIHVREGGFYGPDGNALDDDVVKLLWEPEKDTEVPRPRQDGFPDLESQFGVHVDVLNKKKK
jgi:cell division initiation protein